jgi:hypothetical protein
MNNTLAQNRSPLPSSSHFPSLTETNSSFHSQSFEPTFSVLPFSSLPFKSSTLSASKKPQTNFQHSKMLLPLLSLGTLNVSIHASTSQIHSTSGLPSHAFSLISKQSFITVPTESIIQSLNLKSSTSAHPPNSPSFNRKLYQRWKQSIRQPSNRVLPSKQSMISNSILPLARYLPKSNLTSSLRADPSQSTHTTESRQRSDIVLPSTLPSKSVSPSSNPQRAVSSPSINTQPPINIGPFTFNDLRESQQPSRSYIPSTSTQLSIEAQPSILSTVSRSESPIVLSIDSCNILQGNVIPLCLQNSNPGVFACFTMKEFLPFLPTTGCQPPFKISIRSCHESNFLSKNLIPISGNLKRTSHHNMNSQIPSQVPTKQEMMHGIGKQPFGLQPITHPLFPLTEIENMKPEILSMSLRIERHRRHMRYERGTRGRTLARMHVPFNIENDSAVIRSLLAQPLQRMRFKTKRVKEAVTNGRMEMKGGKKKATKTIGPIPVTQTPVPTIKAPDLKSPSTKTPKRTPIPTPKAKSSIPIQMPTTLLPINPSLPMSGTQRTLDFSNPSCTRGCVTFDDILCLRASKRRSMISLTTIHYIVSDSSGISASFSLKVVIANDSDCIFPISTCSNKGISSNRTAFQ